MGIGTGLTVKQERLARVLASGKAETLTKAAEMAGLSLDHAVRLKSRNVELAKRVETLAERQADRMARFVAKSLTKCEQALDDPECRPEVAGMFLKIGTELRRDEPPTDQVMSASESAEGRALVLQAAMLGARLCARVGREEAARLLGSRLDVLPERIQSKNTIRKLADLAAGE